MSGKTGVFLQVRLGSTRLPGKALLDLEGKTIISHAMEALRTVEADCHVVLTDKNSLNTLKPFSDECGFRTFAGPADDVLLRYIMAASEFGVDTIVRATGDNPLVDAEAAKLVLASHLEADADYSGFDDMPLGTGVEVLKTAMLVRAGSESTDPYDHEHVSPYLYKNPDIFKINRLRAPQRLCLPGSSVTVDTEADYEYIKRLFSSLYRGSPLGIEEIIPWLRKNRRDK